MPIYRLELKFSKKLRNKKQLWQYTHTWLSSSQKNVVIGLLVALLVATVLYFLIPEYFAKRHRAEVTKVIQAYVQTPKTSATEQRIAADNLTRSMAMITANSGPRANLSKADEIDCIESIFAWQAAQMQAEADRARCSFEYPIEYGCGNYSEYGGPGSLEGPLENMLNSCGVSTY